jgi:hypothetical protein
MEATFKITPDSLTEEFISKIKSLFSNNSYIELKIVEIQDETEYLLTSVENNKAIQKSLIELENNRTIKKTMEELEI